MMNLIGKWKVTATVQFNEEKCKMEWVEVEKILAQDNLDKDTIMLMKTVAVFGEDGSIDFLMPLPPGVSQEEVDAAVAAGEITLSDGMMLADQKHWKVENGKNMTDTAPEGEVMGEKVGPWEEVKEIDDHTIEIMTFRLRKAE